MNWFELGGQVFDQTSELSRLGGQWYDPAIGHNLTENGRGIGLNPYPVAENSTPNELPPSYNGSVDTGLNGLERALGRVWLAGQSGTNVVSGASFALRQSADEFRYGVNQAKELYGRVPWWAKAITAAAGPAGLALVITGELGFDLLGGAAGLVAADAETFGRLAEGRFEEAAKGHVASRIGMATNLLPASLVMLGGKGAEWLENKGVPPGLIPRELRAMREGAMWIEQFQAFGKRLDQKQYERGAAAAPLVDEILMLPLNFIPGGRAAAQGAKMGARAVAKPVAKAAVEVAEQVAKKELGWVARTLPRVNAVADWAIHGQLSKVNTRAHDWTARQANRLGFNVCFAAGTLMDTEWGWRKIEEIASGQRLWSQDEFDPDGVAVLKVVEAVFVSEGLLIRLRVNGHDVLTTAEHPFFERENGWTPCNQLKVGDHLRARGGVWVTVEAVEDTGEWATVYNLRVADHHTYFVGGDNWGFALWAHNQNCSGATSYNAMEKKFAAGYDAIFGKRSRHHRVRTPVGNLGAKAGNPAMIRKDFDAADVLALDKLVKQRLQATTMDAKKVAGREIGETGANQATKHVPGLDKAQKVHSGRVGNGDLDQVYFNSTTKEYFVVEAKGLSGRRRSAQVKLSNGREVNAQQFTQDYLDGTIAGMVRSGDAVRFDIGTKLRLARLQEKVHYLEIQTKVNNLKNTQTGYFKIGELKLTKPS